MNRIGGLGHFGLMFAAALGAEVYAISTTESKKADAEKMGAKHFIATKDDIKEAFKPYLRKLDLISMKLLILLLSLFLSSPLLFLCYVFISFMFSCDSQ